jgi:hypothetical protein
MDKIFAQQRNHPTSSPVPADTNLFLQITIRP